MNRRTTPSTASILLLLLSTSFATACVQDGPADNADLTPVADPAAAMVEGALIFARGEIPELRHDLRVEGGPTDGGRIADITLTDDGPLLFGKALTRVDDRTYRIDTREIVDQLDGRLLGSDHREGFVIDANVPTTVELDRPRSEAWIRFGVTVEPTYRDFIRAEEIDSPFDLEGTFEVDYLALRPPMGVAFLPAPAGLDPSAVGSAAGALGSPEVVQIGDARAALVGAAQAYQTAPTAEECLAAWQSFGVDSVVMECPEPGSSLCDEFSLGGGLVAIPITLVGAMVAAETLGGTTTSIAALLAGLISWPVVIVGGVIVLAAVAYHLEWDLELAAGIQVLFAKGGRQNLENQWTRLVKELYPRDPGNNDRCRHLNEAYRRASRSERLAIKVAQKALGCRHSSGGGP